MRLRVAAAVGAAALLVLFGCVPSGAPVTWPADNDLGLPAVEWPFGVPDVSNEWVAALWDAEIALAAAQNAHDFSGRAVAQRVDVELAEDWALSAGMYAPMAADDRSWYFYSPGPRPMVVTGVDVHGDRAEVATCAGSDGDWIGWEGPGATITQLRADDRGTVAVYDLRRDPDGQIRWYGYVYVRAPGCDIDDLRLGYFAPEPPYGAPVSRALVLVLVPDGQPAVAENLW